MLPDWIKDRTHQFLGKNANGTPRGWFQTPAENKEKIIVHHTASNLNATEDEILEFIFNVHNRQKGWPGIAYEYIYIPKRCTKGFSGKWIKLNNDTDVTWHDGSNWDSIGICIYGHYHPDINNTLEPEDFINVKKMLDWLSNENPQIPAEEEDVYGHRDISATACPGDYLYPYVTEYRNKKGEVDWFFDDDGVDCFKIDTDIPTQIEELYELKEQPFYSKYWTFGDFIKNSVEDHRELEALRTEVKDLRKENEVNDKLIEQQSVTIGQKDKQVQQLQKDAQENTVQMGLLSKQIEEANKQKGLAETERDQAKADLKVATTERNNLKTMNKQLKEDLVAQLKGYNWGQRFLSILGIFRA